MKKNILTVIAIAFLIPLSQVPRVLSDIKISKAETQINTELHIPIEVKRIYSFSDSLGGCTKDHKVWVNTRHAYQMSQKAFNKLLVHSYHECSL